MRVFNGELSLWGDSTDGSIEACAAVVSIATAYNEIVKGERAAVTAAKVKEFSDAEEERLAKMADSILKLKPKPPLEVELAP